MPYKDREAQRAYQREWAAKQRQSFFAGKCCVDCGATEELQLDHLDKSQKVSHRIWSWSPKRRAAETAKCVVRCGPCHRERHAAEKRQDHGLGAYRRGCRCGYCRAANTDSKRRGRESNARERLCRPSPEPLGHPAAQPTLFDLEQAA